MEKSEGAVKIGTREKISLIKVHHENGNMRQGKRIIRKEKKMCGEG